MAMKVITKIEVQRCLCVCVTAALEGKKRERTHTREIINKRRKEKSLEEVKYK